MAELPGQLGLSFGGPPARRIWSVRELVGAARTSVEREYADVYVAGEISNLRAMDSGHVYFTLKDGDAQLRIVMFRSAARLLRFKPTDGLEVIARGRITIYEARGELQLSAEHLEPRGAGALQLAFEQMKAKLAAEGLFTAQRKRLLPRMPRSVGVVTSTRGAAIQDILNILRRRHLGLNVIIYPAQVQGASAAAEVTAGVRYFSREKNVDVVIVARGGGPAEDLASFNDEELARAIAACEVPVISAVGHETDFTIADFVADLRAPTPSAAAELVIESKQQVESNVSGMHLRLERAIRYRLLMADREYKELARHQAFARIREQLGRRQQRVDEMAYRLADAQRKQFQNVRQRLESATARVRAHDLRRILAAMRREGEAADRRLQAAAGAKLLAYRNRGLRAEERLQALSPLSILQRGYALVFDEAGALVKDAAAVRAGERVRTRVASGEFTSRVEDVGEKK